MSACRRCRDTCLPSRWLAKICPRACGLCDGGAEPSSFPGSAAAFECADDAEALESLDTEHGIVAELQRASSEDGDMAGAPKTSTAAFWQRGKAG